MTRDGLLGLPLGAPGTGRARYARAMELYNAGQVTVEQLEAYRVAAGDDWGHPALVLAERGLALPDRAEVDAVAALRDLLEEADRYLATLPGPGIAEVRQGLVPARRQVPRALPQEPNAVVTACLGPALAGLRPTHPDLAGAIAHAIPYLRWITYNPYPTDEIGPEFERSHAYATLIGADGNYLAPDFDFGLFFILPHGLYRDHRHPAPELYAPLTGPHGWRFSPDTPLQIKPAHDPVWNPPLQPHLTKVGPVPFLSLYSWTRDCALPANVLPAVDWSELEALRLG